MRIMLRAVDMQMPRSWDAVETGLARGLFVGVELVVRVEPGASLGDVLGEGAEGGALFGGVGVVKRVEGGEVGPLFEGDVGSGSCGEVSFGLWSAEELLETGATYGVLE